MEKYSTIELVRDKENGGLILGREAERKVKKIKHFSVEKKEGERVLQSEEKPRMKSQSLGTTQGLAEYFAKGLEA